jgi:hypothetical protein
LPGIDPAIVLPHEMKPTPKEIALQNGHYEVADFLKALENDIKHGRIREKFDDSIIPNEMDDTNQ